MQDPTQAILTAFLATLASLPLPVYTTLPLDAPDDFVLLSQPLLTPSEEATATDCRAWSASLLLTSYARFPQAGNASFDLSLTASEAILAATVGQRLPLGEFSMSPVELLSATFSQQADDVLLLTQRPVRLRFTVYAATANAPSPTLPQGQPTPVTLPIALDGAQLLPVPAGFSPARAQLLINGLQQAPGSFEARASALYAPADLQLYAGDVVTLLLY